MSSGDGQEPGLDFMRFMRSLQGLKGISRTFFNVFIFNKLR